MTHLERSHVPTASEEAAQIEITDSPGPLCAHFSLLFVFALHCTLKLIKKFTFQIYAVFMFLPPPGVAFYMNQIIGVHVNNV